MIPAFREKANGVPYGTYLLRVERPGFRAWEQMVVSRRSCALDRPRLFCGPPPHLGGSVSPISADLWAKLIPLRGSSGRETKASYGFFGFANVDAGQYLLIVTEGDLVKHTRVLEVKIDTQIRIDLDAVTP